MNAQPNHSSRREFVAQVGWLASVTGLAAGTNPQAAESLGRVVAGERQVAGDWDLSWIDRLATATDRAVFDWAAPGDPAGSIELQIADRYLNNCEAAYGPRKYEARVVLNMRTRAVCAALADPMWERYALGADYKVTDPSTGKPAVRNPFWHRGPAPSTASEPSPGSPMLEDLVRRGAILLVCDFALGHLSARLAAKANRDAQEVHRELRDGFVPSAVAVPSGIFGLARAQNAGCAFVRM